jgi:hypothetical protein
MVAFESLVVKLKTEHTPKLGNKWCVYCSDYIDESWF